MNTGNLLREPSSYRVPVPITEKAKRIANHFASLQLTPEQAHQVQMNTLAVLAVNSYCHMMGIATNLEQSDSWNPLMQMMGDVADLVLPELGRLECRPVISAAHSPVPPDVRSSRIGYLAIALDSDLTTAQLLGFTPALDQGELMLEQLQPIEDLVDHIYRLQQARTAPETSVSNAPASRADSLTQTVVTLSQWLDNALEQSISAGWQAVDALLSADRVAFSMRGEVQDRVIDPAIPSPFDIRRAKLVDLAIQLEQQQVVLLVELNAESAETTHIGVQVHPAHGQPYLAPGLELAILVPTDTGDSLFTKVEARQADEYIQLQFNGNAREQFKVRIQLNQAEYSESFVV